MNIIIFGATGSIGRELVTQALDAGHQVTAFARKPSRLKIRHRALTLSTGNVLNPRHVAAALDGHDAVLIALGAGRKGHVRSAGTANIIDAMKTHGLRRLICETTLGAGDSRALLNFFWKRIMFGLLLRPAYADHLAQEKSVESSELDWTIVRPAAFTNGPRTQTYKHGFPNTQKNLKLKISRSDVADFMLKQLSSQVYLQKTPGLSY